MKYITFFVVFILFLYEWRSHRDITNPVSVLFGLWSVIILLLIVNANNYYEIKEDTYIMIILGMLAFEAGTKLIGCREFTVGGKRGFGNSVFNEQRIKILFIISAIVLLPYLMIAVGYLRTGLSLANIRDQFFSGTSNYRNVSSLVYWGKYYIANPVSFLSYIIAAVTLLSDGHSLKFKRFTLLFSFYFLIVRIMIEGGRADVLSYLSIFIACAYLKYHGKLPAKAKKYIILGIMASFGFFVYLSGLREIDNPLKSFYGYLSGGIVQFDIRRANIEASKVLTGGAASLYGFFEVICNFLSIVLKTGYPAFFKETTMMMSVQDYIHIGPNSVMNAFVTPFYYLYLDGRWLGIFLGMLLYGMFSYYMYVRSLQYGDEKSKSMYLLVFSGLILTFVRIKFVDAPYVLSFIYAMVLFKKVRYTLD